MIAAEHDLTRTDLRSEVAQRFRGEDQGIEIELLQVFGRPLLEGDVRVASRGVDETGMVGAVRI